MSVTLIDTGLILVTVRYVKALKPGGPLSYYRRIPRDLTRHYGGLTFIRKSLGTKDPNEATKKAARLAAADDGLWASLRSPEGQAEGLTSTVTREAAKTLLSVLGLAPGMLVPGTKLPAGVDPTEALDDHFHRQYGEDYLRARHEPHLTPLTIEGLMSPVETEALRLLKEDPRRARCLLSDALAVYLQEHDKGDDPAFAAGATRAIGHVYEAVGDFPLSYYRREHAVQVRDFLLKSGNKTATVRGRLNDIKAVFNRGLVEFNLGEYRNPFERLQIAKEEQDAETREPFTAEELRTLTAACRLKDDALRHIVLMQSDTGARLSEIVGLRIEDVFFDHETPHIMIRPHLRLGRSLKTDASERHVPLVGEALWAAERALNAYHEGDRKTGWLFPRQAEDGKVKSSSASAAINKWIKERVGIAKTTHGLRHSMRGRLRHADVPPELQDIIGGWGSRSVGQGYGEGYLLRQLKEQLEKVVVGQG